MAEAATTPDTEPTTTATASATITTTNTTITSARDVSTYPTTKVEYPPPRAYSHRSAMAVVAAKKM